MFQKNLSFVKNYVTIILEKNKWGTYMRIIDFKNLTMKTEIKYKTVNFEFNLNDKKPAVRIWI